MDYRSYIAERIPVDGISREEIARSEEHTSELQSQR